MYPFQFLKVNLLLQLESPALEKVLLNAIGALDTSTAGKVFIDGKDIFSMKEEKLTIFRRRKYRFCFSGLQFDSGTQRRAEYHFSLAFGLSKTGCCNVEELLSVLGLKDRRNYLPRQLSGGQQQRVAIGRALINHPMLILADEPTGNLDSKNSKDVVSLLKAAASQYRQTIIMITHNQNIASGADRVLQVSDGVLTDLCHLYHWILQKLNQLLSMES